MEIIIFLGFLAALLTTISSLPQVIKTIRTKHTKDISLGMYLLLTSGITLWLIYGIFTQDLPIIFANVFSLFLVLIVLGFKIRYG